jgi:hypothetical protein
MFNSLHNFVREKPHKSARSPARMTQMQTLVSNITGSDCCGMVRAAWAPSEVTQNRWMDCQNVMTHRLGRRDGA